MNLDNPGLLWFLAGLLLILLEFAIPGVIIVFFGLGAWTASLFTFLGVTPDFDAQVLVFGVTSVILLVVLRKVFRGKGYGFVTRRQDLGQDLDEFTGKPVTVLDRLAPGATGRVRFKGSPWQAVSDDTIEAGETARIISCEGITLRVRKPTP